jgi:hypothetical protein
MPVVNKVTSPDANADGSPRRVYFMQGLSCENSLFSQISLTNHKYGFMVNI